MSLLYNSFYYYLRRLDIWTIMQLCMITEYLILSGFFQAFRIIFSLSLFLFLPISSPKYAATFLPMSVFVACIYFI